MNFLYKSVLLAAAFFYAGATLVQAANLNAAVLPNSRAVDTATTATFFATIANSGTSGASNCAIGLSSAAPATMAVSYQTTDAANALTGTANTPVAIAAGALQSFLVSVSSSAAFTGKVPLTFSCVEGSANAFAEVNQPDIRFTSTRGPDVIAIGATLSNDGIAVLDRGPNLAAMSISAVNIGGATAVASAPAKPQANAAPITVTGDVSGFLTVGNFDILLCETDLFGVCQAPLGTSVSASIGDTAHTFSAFLVGDPDMGLPFFPSDYRMRILFTDANGNIVGSTSVALNSDAPAGAGTEPVGYWEVNFRRNDDFTGQGIRKGGILIPPASLPILGFVIRQDPVTSAFLPQVFRMDGQFDPVTKTRTGNLLFFDVGNIVGATLPATLSYTPGKQITLAYVVAAADAPQKGPPDGAGAQANPLSGLLGGSGSAGGTTNPLAGLLGGSGSGSGNGFTDRPSQIKGNLGGSGGNNTVIDDVKLTVDPSTGAVTTNSTKCPGTTAETTKFDSDPTVFSFDTFGLIGMFMTIVGCPTTISDTNPGLDGYLALLFISAKLKAGKPLTPQQQKFINILGAGFGGSPVSPSTYFIGTTFQAQATSDFNAIMSNLESAN